MRPTVLVWRTLIANDPILRLGGQKHFGHIVHLTMTSASELQSLSYMYTLGQGYSLKHRFYASPPGYDAVYNIPPFSRLPEAHGTLPVCGPVYCELANEYIIWGMYW